ncbi:MAG: transmembrane protein, distant homology with ydbS [uncultured Nocardioidaceae bacterium]|uniref:Transmembrane protein, distant homology with ydbS n=1 Tax=uncultured Nocardioidaceae bacterium TaxID=253824 RepID=A0A6J4NGN6_9ACTN|nr:MAG: transmembrane protein, distant homology with ydbS [uncultured Nocardioidaceae bacterium]
MDDLFAVPGAPWQRVSPRLVSLHRAVLLAQVGVVLLLLGAVAWMWPTGRPWLLGAAGVLVVLTGPAWVLVSRSARSWAYAERDEDLFVRHGVMWLRLEVVPYGRMQLVDVTAGPLQRRNGIATLTMRTASPSTQASIPGLPSAEAARLRDRLTERGEAQAAGL